MYLHSYSQYLNNLTTSEEYTHLSPFLKQFDNTTELIQELIPSSCYVFKKKLFDLEENSLVFMKHPNYFETLIHCHDFIEIEYVVKGEVTQYINGERVLLNKGSLCIFNKNVVHYIEKARKTDLMYHILVNENLFDLNFFTMTPENLVSEFLYKSLFLDQQFNDFIIIEDLTPDITEVLNEMMEEIRMKRPNHQKILYAYMTILFGKLSRTTLRQSFFSSYKDYQKTRMLNKILNYVQANYRDCTLQSTADAFHLHPNYFCKVIKELTGTNFSELLCHTKMHIASHLLTTTELTIDTIAQEIGYSNTNNFYKKFKDYYGMTPKMFRQDWLNADRVVVK